MLTINKRIAHTVVQTNQAVLPSTGSLSKYASDSNLMYIKSLEGTQVTSLLLYHVFDSTGFWIVEWFWTP